MIAASRPQPQPGGQESATLTPPRSEDHEPGPPPLAPAPDRPWVAAHRPTALWSGPGEHARLFRPVEPGAHFQVARPQDGAMLHVWDPVARNYAYIEAVTVGPAEDPAREPPPAGPRREDRAADLTLAPRPFWSGTARVTMYTCVELGGCNRTASGIWPYEGVVAVDPRVIPLGSTVWIEGLGTFLAADTGSAVRGHHIDVFARDYNRAIQWGVRHRAAAAYRGR